MSLRLLPSLSIFVTQTGKFSLHEIADREKGSVRFVSVHLDLAFMAPDAVASVVDGRHPSFMNAQALRTVQLHQPGWNSAQLLHNGRHSLDGSVSLCFFTRD